MKSTEPHIFVIFGASGDLTRRKLIPAVFELYKSGYLPDDFALLGVSRSKLSDEQFRHQVLESNEHIESGAETDRQKAAFAERLFYEAIDTKEVADYQRVVSRLSELEQRFGTAGNIIFYLSTPPFLYDVIPARLAEVGLHRQENGWRRLVIEKPFGADLASARNLNASLKRNFDESQIYRIDHYLGKETVQNLLVTRFANGIFEPLWNRNYVHHVQVTSAEPFGVGGRGGYYDTSGALRDMLQNHLMQVVAHVAMEPPVDASADAIRAEKSKLFRSLRHLDPSDFRTDAIRGQYTSSMVRGEKVNGYRDEEGVPDDSKTETYAALKFYIENWRWSGVPFYVRTGKRLPTRVAEIVVTFKRPPQALFRDAHGMFDENNQLIMRIQPDEGLLLSFGMKVPGEGFNVTKVGMDFHYKDLCEDDVPAAYERLLLDAMKGDPTLYAHGDSVEYCWEFVDPIVDAWKNDPDLPVYGYPAGTWGPEAADDMISPEAMTWRNPCRNLTADLTYCEL
ncbi:MAG: glucose-6-phosphate dehydrogenase [Planctomycetota bacterium]